MKLPSLIITALYVSLVVVTAQVCPTTFQCDNAASTSVSGGFAGSTGEIRQFSVHAKYTTPGGKITGFWLVKNSDWGSEQASSADITITQDADIVLTFLAPIPVTAGDSILLGAYMTSAAAYYCMDNLPNSNGYDNSLQQTLSNDVDISVTIECVTSTSGDPHFLGFHNQKYDVMGQSYEVYNIISSPTLQINSRFVPYYKQVTQVVPTGTMLGEVGIKFFNHKVYLNSNSSEAVIDGTIVNLLSEWTLKYDYITLSNEVSGRMYQTTISTPVVSMTFVRKVYMITGLELQWHYDYKASLSKNVSEMHGLLGQTVNNKIFEDKSGPWKYLEGEEEDYRIVTNNLFGDDFTFNLFHNQ